MHVPRKTIKKLLGAVLLALVFLSVSASKTYSQQTENSTPTVTNQTDEQARIQLVGALERAQTEVKASRKYISGLKEQVAIKEARIKALNDKDALSAQAIAGLQSEIKNLRLAIAETEKAIKIRSDEVEQLKKDLNDTRKKLHRARTFAKYLTVTAAALAAALVLK